MTGIFKYIINKNYHLRGMLILIFFIFSLPVFANPYFSMLASAPQSAKYREVLETTNDWGWTIQNNYGSISNATFTWWGRTENSFPNSSAAIMLFATTKPMASSGEDVLNGDLGWDDSWLALTGETNITTTLTTNIAYCVVGTSENTCDIDYGGVTNTVVGDFDFLANNFDNNLRINTTGNFRLGMIPAETNKCITATFISTGVQGDSTTKSMGGDDTWAFYTAKFTGSSRSVSVDYSDGTSTNYTTVLSEPWVFEKGCYWQFGYAQFATGAYTNMFFDMRGYAGILATNKTSAIQFDGLCELENRGWSSTEYACIFDGVDDYVTIPYDASLFQENMTVSFWVNSYETNYAGNVYTFCQYDSGSLERTWAIRITGADDKWTVVTGNSVGASTISVATSKLVELGMHFIAFVVDNQSKTWDFFYDGAFVEQINAGYSYVDNGSYTQIIRSTTFAGLAADIRMYGRLLSTNEIINLYNKNYVSDASLVMRSIALPAGSARYPQTMVENGYRETVGGTNLYNSGTGELGIEVVQ